MFSKAVSRRRLLAGSALTLFGSALPVASSHAQDRHARFKGQTVAFSIPDHPHFDAMLKLLPQFTAETGIKVDVARDNILRMKHVQMAELAKPQSSLDLVTYIVTWKGEYVKKKLIAPLEGFLNNRLLADPDYAFGDLVPRYVQNIGLVGGPKGYLPGPGAKLYGLPYGAETSVLAYRRDVFEKHGFVPPRTYADLADMLGPLREKTGIGALTSRGQSGHNCVHAWLLHFNALGGRFFDDQWMPLFHRSEGVQALELLKHIADTGPKGIPQFSYNDSLASFLQGESAMYLDSTAVFGAVRSSPLSKVDGKVSYALHPRGTRYASQSGGLGLAIARNSARSEAAFLLLQWLTSKAQDKAVVRLGGGPSRLSTMSDSEVVRQYPEFITLKEQLRYSEPDWRPIIPEWDEINTGPLGAAVYQGMTGAKPADKALSDIVRRVNDIMAAAGYR
ncbi:ABC transporter substrate-binding protein [Rhodoferax mekongensis]|uniref:Extracellular solute-binding protein n=1 Tax=Rhodoferax mekongensis TaxID=3068341 RepID=A0ABZ0B3J0_9BURK|nr:extracellular solute-binding protein [Rhodoferax sp. TBRC 17307]WNO06471.1 extracellular solute-binding protein [Rhodoferax sp. TBRC 17307]